MARKRKPRSLGIVPRSLLRGAIAGAIPMCALSGCTSDSQSADAADTRSFGVDAAAFDAAADMRTLFAVDAAAFSVADVGFHPDAAPEAPDGGADGPAFSVADTGFRQDGSADRPDASPDHTFFAVDAPAFKG